jgi:hypothetical protein
MDEQGSGQSGDEWTALGRELRELDPRRYVELKELAERIVRVRRDPVREAGGVALTAVSWIRKTRGAA